LATNDHCSSNSAARVEGGKAQQLVVELLGLVARPPGIANDGVLIHAGQAAGLTDATAFVEVGEDVKDLVVGESGVEERSALAFRETVLASTASEHAAFVWAIAEGDAEVVTTAAAVVRALGVLTAEAAQIVGHGNSGK
jgi:hypothetical protein